MKKDWEDRKDSFEVVDVRELSGNFLPKLLKKGADVPVDEGICVIQSFEPIPLYSAMADLGFEHLTDRVSDSEYRVCFYRFEKRDGDFGGDSLPFKPTAIVNVKGIDDSLADIVINFWNLIWGKEKSAIDQKTKLLLSLANGVGAGRLRQATRELIKSYSLGASTDELDELFSMFVWNQGVGNFASEIGPSALFGAYQLIKRLEGSGKSRKEVVDKLMEKFGENNPEVGTFYKAKK